MTSGDIAAALGRGLVAGVVGTAAMTVSSTLEAKIRDRDGSTAPADAAAKVLGVEPASDAAKARFSNVVHWSYGTGWGAALAMLRAVGLPAPVAGPAHFATVWGSALVMLPRTGVAPPVREWGATEVGIDAFHHAQYALFTSIAYGFLERHTSGHPPS